MNIKSVDSGKLYTPVFFEFIEYYTPTADNSCVVNRSTGKVLAKHQEIADRITEEILYALKYRYINEFDDLVQIIFEGDKWYINLSFRYATYSVVKNTLLIGDVPKDKQDIITKVLNLFGTSIIKEPYPGCLAISKEHIPPEEKVEYTEQEITVLSLDFYIRVLERTSLGIYL